MLNVVPNFEENTGFRYRSVTKMLHMFQFSFFLLESYVWQIKKIKKKVFRNSEVPGKFVGKISRNLQKNFKTFVGKFQEIVRNFQKIWTVSRNLCQKFSRNLSKNFRKFWINPYFIELKKKLSIRNSEKVLMKNVIKNFENVLEKIFSLFYQKF